MCPRKRRQDWTPKGPPKSLYQRWVDGELTVELWFERDRSFIGIQEAESGEYIASWEDEDVQSMFEDGFFRANRGERALKKSVIEYAESVGLPAYPR